MPRWHGRRGQGSEPIAASEQGKVVWAHNAPDHYLAIICHIADENPEAAGRVVDRFGEVPVAFATFATGLFECLSNCLYCPPAL